jgi:hypothetical protein
MKIKAMLLSVYSNTFNFIIVLLYQLFNTIISVSPITTRIPN